MRTYFSPTQRGASRPTSHSVSEIVSRLLLCSNAEARALLSEDLARRYAVLPLGKLTVLGEEIISCAVANGSEAEVAQMLRFSLQRRVRVVGVDPAILQEAIARAYAGDEAKLSSSAARLNQSAPTTAQVLSLRPESGDAAHFLADLIEYGFSRQASDIHLIPRHSGTEVRLRIQGELQTHPHGIGSRESHQQLLARLRVLAALPVSNADSSGIVDGAFQVPFGTQRRRIRLSVMPTLYGEKAVLRLVEERSEDTVATLRYPVEVAQQFERYTSNPSGLLVIAGPTGSGKSTALYAVAQQLADTGRNVVTVEDPIERELRDISQTAVCDARGLTYVAALQGVLRQDPEVVLIGEIRDAQSAQVACAAALSGHAILTSIHASSIPDVALRLHNFGVDWLTISQSMQLTVVQRLVRLLCESCRVIDLEGSRAAFEQGATGDTLRYRPVGCSRCQGSGYSTRVPDATALWVTERERALLRLGEVEKLC